MFGGASAPWQGFLDDDATNSTQVCKRRIRKGRVQRVQHPASAGLQQLPEGPLAFMPRQDVRSVLGQSIRLDDDYLALKELGRHAVTTHHQRKRLAAAAVRQNSILHGGQCISIGRGRV